MLSPLAFNSVFTLNTLAASNVGKSTESITASGILINQPCYVQQVPANEQPDGGANQYRRTRYVYFNKPAGIVLNTALTATIDGISYDIIDYSQEAPCRLLVREA